MAPRSHEQMISPMSRTFAAPAQMAAIRALETSGALTPAMARNARARVITPATVDGEGAK